MLFNFGTGSLIYLGKVNFGLGERRGTLIGTLGDAVEGWFAGAPDPEKALADFLLTMRIAEIEKRGAARLIIGTQSKENLNKSVCAYSWQWAA